jgi:heme exporter protein B
MMFNFLNREVKAIIGDSSLISSVLIYFIIAISVVNFVLSGMTSMIAVIAGSVFSWIILLLISVNFGYQIYFRDFLDGSIDKILLSGYSLMLFMLIKLFVHWVFIVLPLGILSALNIKILLNSPLSYSMILSLAVFSTFIIACFISFSTLIAFRAKLGNMLLGIISIPLLMPLLIFISAVSISQQLPYNIEAIFRILSGSCLVLLVVIPFINSLIIKEVGE